ncbi:hypothetical protein KCP73_19170 [Salmonella enterica subsp. enterica]|nr:hypothetical protein KCP73_19170 [Salmonella enterica subsp. enterica]
MIGALIVVGKVLAGGKTHSPPRVCLPGACCSAVLSHGRRCCSGSFLICHRPCAVLTSMLGIAGYQVAEIAIQRRFKSQKGRRCRSQYSTRISPPFWTCWRIPKERRTIRRRKTVATTSLLPALMRAARDFFSPISATTLRTWPTRESKSFNRRGEKSTASGRYFSSFEVFWLRTIKTARIA